MIERAPDRPWYPERTRSAMRGRVVLRVAPGEAPEGIPFALDAARGAQVAPWTFDGGPIDRIVRRHSAGMRVMRPFSAARTIGHAGEGHLGWDDVEESTGLSRTFVLDLDSDAAIVNVVRDLRACALVEEVSPSYLCVTPFGPGPEPESDEPRPPKDPWYAYRMVQAKEALELEPGDSALITAVVDSGVDVEHPELTSGLRPGVDTVDLPSDRISRGLKLVGDSTRRDRMPRDEMGHGTACAGILGARGVRLPRGLAGAASVMPVRVLAGARIVDRKKMTAVGSTPDIDAGLKLCIDLGASVLNMSFGTPAKALREGDPIPHRALVDYAMRRGCLLIAASGNSGGVDDYYPAALPQVLAVGSVGPERRPSSFTTRGDHVDLCAPGEHLPSASVGGYARNSGTSFAAPFVTAACALLVARGRRFSRTTDLSTVRALLTQTASPFAPGGDSSGCGAGILDVPAALRVYERALRAADAGVPLDAPVPISRAVQQLNESPTQPLAP